MHFIREVEQFSKNKMAKSFSQYLIYFAQLKSY